MEILSMIRSIGALGLVLGMLAGALWAVRRYDIKLPGRVSNTRRKRVEIVERLAVDAKRSVALIRRDGCEHLIMFGPEGQATIETGIVAPPVAAEPEVAPEPVADFQADLAALTSNFSKMLELPKAKLAEIKDGIKAIKPAANDVAAADKDEDEVEAIERPSAEIIQLRPVAVAAAAAAAAKRTRRPRDTARWNRRAVRDALNA